MRYCPKCGGDVAPENSSATNRDADVHSLLASANLHRIRAEWDSAIEDATNALRLDPRNPDVPSLLGGIYEERGMHDEAMAWYQMALEINPDSTPDKERLLRLSDLILADNKRSETASPSALHRNTKLAWAIGGVFILIIIVAVVSLIKVRNVNVTPPQPPLPAASLPYGSSPRTSSSEPQLQRPSAPANTSTPASPSAGASVRTPGEVYIRSELAATQAIADTGAGINDVIADPRAGVVSVTFSVPFSPVLTKDRIIAAAAATARRTFELNREVKFVTARCLIEISGAQGTQIAFVADIARQSADALPASATADQLSAVFTRQWWNPQIQ